MGKYDDVLKLVNHALDHNSSKVKCHVLLYGVGAGTVMRRLHDALGGNSPLLACDHALTAKTLQSQNIIWVTDLERLTNSRTIGTLLKIMVRHDSNKLVIASTSLLAAVKKIYRNALYNRFAIRMFIGKDELL